MGPNCHRLQALQLRKVHLSDLQEKSLARLLLLVLATSPHHQPQSSEPPRRQAEPRLDDHATRHLSFLLALGP